MHGMGSIEPTHVLSITRIDNPNQFCRTVIFRGIYCKESNDLNLCCIIARTITHLATTSFPSIIKLHGHDDCRHGIQIVLTCCLLLMCKNMCTQNRIIYPLSDRHIVMDDERPRGCGASRLGTRTQKLC